MSLLDTGTKTRFVVELYMSGLNMMAPILNEEQKAMVGAKTKKPN